MDVDVTTTADERGVGAMVDATEAKRRKIWSYLHFNMTEKEKPYTTQTAINCIEMFYKASDLNILHDQVQRILT